MDTGFGMAPLSLSTLSGPTECEINVALFNEFFTNDKKKQISCPGRDRDDYFLGKGADGLILKVTRDTEVLALKVAEYETTDKAKRDRFFRESDLTKSVVSDHVIKIEEIVDTQSKLPGVKNNYIMTLLPFADCGDLLRIILDGDAFGIDDIDGVLSFGLQIAKGVKAISDMNIVHRDIRPENIFIRDGTTAMIADFGFAVKMPSSEGMAKGLSQTYIDPAAGNPAAKQYPKAGFMWSPKSDIYSLGVVFRTMVTVERGMYNDQNNQLAVKKALDKQPSNMPAETPQRLAWLVSQMTLLEPNDRPTIDEVIKGLEDAQKHASEVLKTQTPIRNDIKMTFEEFVQTIPSGQGLRQLLLTPRDLDDADPNNQLAVNLLLFGFVCLTVFILAGVAKTRPLLNTVTMSNHLKTSERRTAVSSPGLPPKVFVEDLKA